MSNLSVTPTPATTKPISRITTTTKHLPTQRFHSVRASSQRSDQVAQGSHFQRRSMALGLGGVVLGLIIRGENAKAAARRAPPPPVQEKRDPSVSGLMAKVLASKKRKEAMKDSMTKLREKGKAVKDSIIELGEKGKEAIQEQSQKPDSPAD
ncbi:hypothetical protein F511_18276 [Dorcoceras hygrometricum]|uniref:Uncharacterized protein n=1 Tax=Dorcoceras hygrometricum TaxID=472368 RepID=A0A2Z7CMZ5_9LAMI|nr:hypothetical protein F511_18276 [Dorcoceras hygrometricum]